MSSTARTSSPARRNGSSEAPSGPRTVAVLHESASRGGVVAVCSAVGPISADGSAPRSPGKGPSFRKFSPDQVGSLRGFLRETGVDLVIRIVPSIEAICRLAPLPEGASTQNGAALADALTLLAESDLPAQLPWYRRVSGLAMVGGVPQGLLLGWHPASGRSSGSAQRDLLVEALQGIPQLYTGEAVALAAILRAVRSSDQPESAPGCGWVVSGSPIDGAATVLAYGPSGAKVRSLRAAAADPEVWRADLADAVAETLESVGDDDGAALAASRLASLASDRASIVLCDDSRPVVSGERRDPSWISDFGIAAATLEVFADPNPAVRSLFALHATEPRERANPVIRLVNYLSSPARAAAIVIVCGAALLGTRLGVAYARHQSVNRQVASSPELSAKLAEAEKQVAFANVLKARRWPMTKLIADIAAATPVGIELESLEITRGEPVVIRGTAPKNDLISQFRENLTKTRVFDNVVTPNITSSPNGVQFGLQARATDAGAVYQAPPIDDFAKNPLGKRIHGEDWVPDKSATALKRVSSGAIDGNRGGRGSDRSSSSASASRDSGRASSSSSARGAPSQEAEDANKRPPLSDADIAKMTKIQAMLEWTKRKKDAGVATDKDVAERLRTESEKCKARHDELKAAEERGGK